MDRYDMSKYTARDFANARFAEHDSGRAVAARWTSREDAPDEHWTLERPWNNRFTKEATDQEMVNMDGWSPVPTKPTITESEYGEAVRRGDSFSERLALLGIEITPDPEPTNAEKLARLHDEYIRFPGQHLPGNGSFADYLDHKGVKAPDNE